MDAHINFMNHVNQINHMNEMTRFMNESIRNHQLNNYHSSNDADDNDNFSHEFEIEFEKRKKEIEAVEAEILKSHKEFGLHFHRSF